MRIKVHHPLRRPGHLVEWRRQSQLRPTRSQLTSLGSHSVLILEKSRAASADPHFGQGGDGLSEVERYSSNRSSHFSHRYS